MREAEREREAAAGGGAGQKDGVRSVKRDEKDGCCSDKAGGVRIRGSGRRRERPSSPDDQLTHPVIPLLQAQQPMSLARGAWPARSPTDDGGSASTHLLLMNGKAPELDQCTSPLCCDTEGETRRKTKTRTTGGGRRWKPWRVSRGADRKPLKTKTLTLTSSHLSHLHHHHPHHHLLHRCRPPSPPPPSWLWPLRPLGAPSRWGTSAG